MIGKMQMILFVISIPMVLCYLFVTAVEDYRTCEVTRWKHCIGFFPAAVCFVVYTGRHAAFENIMMIVFAVILLLIGRMRIYGLADGFVLANLALFSGAIGGVAGIGVVVLTMVISCFSFLLCYFQRCMVRKERISWRMQGALIPHIMTGYIVVNILLLIQMI